MGVKIKEAYVLAVEVEFCHADGTVTMFFNENFSNVWAVGFLIDFIFTVDEHHDVGILLDRA